MQTTFAPSSTVQVCNRFSPFPTCHVAKVEPPPPGRTWLVESLWLNAGVGILCGHPKSWKTFWAVEIAMAVASGRPALDSYPVAHRGTVLFYGAEDSLPSLRTRFDGLANLKHLDLAALPIYLIDMPQIRLDRADDIGRLGAVIEQTTPRLLVLDPFVRMVSIDENSAADVSCVLASLRALQRKYDLAILVVHHARKSPAAHPMQALRGSSDFAAWSDTNVYLARKAKTVTVTIEHRSAPAPEPFTLTLDTHPAPHLVLAAAMMPLCTLMREPQDDLAAEIRKLLASTAHPMPTVEIRELLCKRKSDVVMTLERMRQEGHVNRAERGWTLS